MNIAVVVVFLLTFLINYIGTLSLAVRMVGIKTKLWSMSYAIFNVVALVARLANTIQAPLLAKHIEVDIQNGQESNINLFHFIIIGATLGTAAGGYSIPSFQRVLTVAVKKYYEVNSFPKLILSAALPKAWPYYQKSLVLPSAKNLYDLKSRSGISTNVIILNVIISAITTISVLSCLYAGYLNPTLRATAASMNGVVNSFSVILALLFVDPYTALFTDEVNLGRRSDADFKRFILNLVAARLLGTLLAQCLLYPFAYFIVFLIEINIF